MATEREKPSGRSGFNPDMKRNVHPSRKISPGAGAAGTVDGPLRTILACRSTHMLRGSSGTGAIFEVPSRVVS